MDSDKRGCSVAETQMIVHLEWCGEECRRGVVVLLRRAVGALSCDRICIVCTLFLLNLYVYLG